MLIFLYGQDTYRSRQKLSEIIAQYQKIHQSGLNLRFFDFKNDNFEDFRDKFRISSMFKEKKFIVLRNAFSNKDFKKKFLDLSKDFVESENIILFYEKDEVSEKDSLFLFLKENAKLQDFKPLSTGALDNWLKKELGKYNVEIEEKAKSLLLDYVGNDLWQLSNELKKLALYKSKCQNVKISKEDVESLVKAKIETDIFKTIDLIAKRDKRKALSLLHKHLEKGDSPLYLLSMISFQFRNLLMIKERSQLSPYPHPGTMSRDLRLHPFVVKKGLQLARNFSLAELKEIYQKIFETDIKIKTGQLEPEMALDLLITEI